jgi:acyl-CoA thioesterase
MKSPAEIVQLMLEKDSFSKWLGIEVLLIEENLCRLGCTIKSDMLNGFEIAHGGITYSLADSCLAFAANSCGYQCVSIETSISHLKKVKLGDYLITEAHKLKEEDTTKTFEITIHNQDALLVARFTGLVHVSTRIW